MTESAPDASRVRIAVIKTNEEAMIARHVQGLLAQPAPGG